MASYSSALLNQLIFFMLCSGLLAVLCVMFTRLLPSLRNWSQYWLILLVAALVPLVPLSFVAGQRVIPAVLFIAIDTPTHALVNLTQPLTVQSDGLMSDVSLWLLLVLLLGSIIVLCRFVASNWRVQQVIAGAQEDHSLLMFTQSQKDFIKRRSLKVYVTSTNMSPFVWGVLRTRLVVPRFVFELPICQFQLLVDHELTHVQRGDQRSIMFFRLCAALFWFNPLILYIEKQFVRAMELNCDADVIDRFPNLKQDYARALVASLRLSHSHICEKSAVHFTDKKSNKKEYEGRIRHAMMDNRGPHYGFSYKALLLVFFAVVVSFSAFAQANVELFGEPIDLHRGLLPVAQARISSPYGVIDKIRNNKPHRGIDLVAPLGTDVIASYGGEVIVADDVSLHKNFGLTVLIRYGNIETLYAHLDRVVVKAGDRVRAGDSIGTVGETGRATGPHLHFELIQNGQHIDPILYLK